MSEEWIEWNGGEMPVSGDMDVQIKCECGDVYTDKAKHCKWDNKRTGHNIIAYRIVQPVGNSDKLPPEYEGAKYGGIKSDSLCHSEGWWQKPASLTDAPKTLRDEFAMAALPEFLTLELVDVPTLLKRFPKAKNSEDLAAIMSYVVADAMMEARKK